jgi:phage FluMu protein Com
MPIRPPALEIRCPQCGWQQVWQPASDALTTTDLPPESCPRCKHAELQVRPSSTASALCGRLKQWLTPS